MNRRALRAISVGASLAACLALAPLIAAPAAVAAPHRVAGDFDGDGKADLAVGAPGGNRVRISYTSAHPGGSHVSFLHASEHSYHYPMQFGYALATGDFNDDGFADLAVGAPDYTTPPNPDLGSGVLETRGAVFIFFGSSTGLHEQPLTMQGPYDGDDPFNLGQALAAADVNGDGSADLAVTLLGADNGNIRVYQGSPSGFTSTFQPLDDYEATSLAFGDVNGDHHPELIAASTVDLENPTDEDYGDLLIFHGRASGLNPASPQKIRGDQVGLFRDLGTSVATGDVNGDGITDVVAGAAYDRDIHHASAGTIVLLTGGAHGLHAARHQLVRERAVNSAWHDGNGFGAALSIAKINGDRFADVVVGAPTERVGAKNAAGAAYVLRGSASGISTSHVQRLTQATPGIAGTVARRAHFGAAVLASKLNRDRFADLLVGAPNRTTHAAHSGMFVRLLGTSTGITTHAAGLVGDTHANDHLGFSIR
ncbi:MAG TPA: FG-GAP-like repeat-containing protein [Jatrophihabitantaceae bacterium]|nr:FG-GAP-like repeat-containing protein [Jatrophihabitantaceae bacterium]